MTEALELIRRAFDEFGKRVYGTKRGSAWYRDDTEIVAVAEMQPSEWDGEQYVNLGFVVRSLTEDPFPKPGNAHVWLRLQRLGGVDPDIVGAVFNSDTEIAPEERRRLLFEILDDHLRPVVESASLITRLRVMLEDGPLDQAQVRVNARSALGLPPLIKTD